MTRITADYFAQILRVTYPEAFTRWQSLPNSAPRPRHPHRFDDPMDREATAIDNLVRSWDKLSDDRQLAMIRLVSTETALSDVYNVHAQLKANDEFAATVTSAGRLADSDGQEIIVVDGRTGAVRAVDPTARPGDRVFTGHMAGWEPYYPSFDENLPAGVHQTLEEDARRRARGLVDGLRKPMDPRTQRDVDTAVTASKADPGRNRNAPGAPTIGQTDGGRPRTTGPGPQHRGPGPAERS
jgi:hypothetical protein